MGKNYHLGENSNYSCFWPVGNLREKPVLVYSAVARVCGFPLPNYSTDFSGFAQWCVIFRYSCIYAETVLRLL